MTVNPPTTAQPVSTGYWQIGRESAPNVVATAFASCKSKPIKPNNKPSWLRDESMWGDMAELHDLQQGPTWSELEIPESPLYGDTAGHLLLGLFGDYVTTGTASTPSWTTSAVLAAGATTIAVTSATSAVAGTFIQIDTGQNAEVVTVGTGSTATSIVVSANTPLRFSHLTATAVVTVIAPFTHVFSLLNPASSTGLTSCQPPSHSIVHHNYLPGSGGFFADLFTYGVVTDFSLMGDAKGWLTYSAKISAYTQTAPAGTISAALSTIKGMPSWKSTTTIASSAIPDIAKWSLDFARKPDIIPTADGQQSPYFMGLGQMKSTFKMTYSPATDESALNEMLQSTMPTIAWATSNGLSGSNLVSLTVNTQLAGYMEAPLTAISEFWGFETSGELVASATNAGNSGGNSPCSVTLVNSVSSY